MIGAILACRYKIVLRNLYGKIIDYLEPGLQEKDRYEYILTDPDTNTLYLLMPIIGGEAIGIDNTCETLRETRVFLSKEYARHKGGEANNAILTGAHEVLTQFKKDLTDDLATCGRKGEFENKIPGKMSRLNQVVQYLEAINHVKSHSNLNCLNDWLGEYPGVISDLLKTRSNAFAMLLDPKDPDTYTRMREYTFKLERSSYLSHFTSILRTAYTDTAIKSLEVKTSRERLLDRVMSTYQTNFKGMNDDDGAEETFGIIKILLKDEMVRTYPDYAEHIDLNHSRFASKYTTSDQNTLSFENADNICSFDDDSTARDYADAILNCAIEDPFWTNENQTESPFNLFYKRADQLSIMTQFFMGLANMHAHAVGLTQCDFGALLDANTNLAKGVAKTVLEALRHDANVEVALLTYINKNINQFGYDTEPFRKDDIIILRRRFAELYNTIEPLDHKDEFLVYFDDVNGDFINHQSRISINFAKFMQMGFHTKNATFFQDKQASFIKYRARQNQSDSKKSTEGDATLTRQIDLAVITGFANDVKVNSSARHYSSHLLNLLDYMDTKLPGAAARNKILIDSILDNSVSVLSGDHGHRLKLQQDIDSLLHDPSINLKAAGLVDKILYYLNKLISLLSFNQLNFFQSNCKRVKFDHAKAYLTEAVVSQKQRSLNPRTHKSSSDHQETIFTFFNTSSRKELPSDNTYGFTTPRA